MEEENRYSESRGVVEDRTAETDAKVTCWKRPLITMYRLVICDVQREY